MSLRRAVSALALLLVAGCGGAEAGSSTEGADNDKPIDAVMEQRLAVDRTPRPRAPSSPTREDGVDYADYFFGSLEYAMRSGFAMDFRLDFNFYCDRCRAVWKRINDEYANNHYVQMTPIHVDTVRVIRGPFRRPGFQRLSRSQRQFDPYFWVVEVGYHIDKLSIRDSEGEIESGTALSFVDRLLVASTSEWQVWLWKSSLSDPDTPILGHVPKAAA
jgi:hypothetical protein